MIISQETVEKIMHMRDREGKTVNQIHQTTNIPISNIRKIIKENKIQEIKTNENKRYKKVRTVKKRKKISEQATNTTANVIEGLAKTYIARRNFYSFKVGDTVKISTLIFSWTQKRDDVEKDYIGKIIQMTNNIIVVEYEGKGIRECFNKNFFTCMSKKIKLLDRVLEV
jgi:uncharacterized protein YvpB